MLLCRNFVFVLWFYFWSTSKLQYRNSHFCFNLLLLISGDRSLNPGLLHNNQLQSQSEWSGFNLRWHFIHLNVNSLLPKIYKLRNITKLSNAAVIGISESKLDDFILSSELHIDNYNTLRCDRNWHWGGVVCNIRNDLSYDVKFFFEIENTFLELLLPIRNQRLLESYIDHLSDFLEIINTHFSKLGTKSNEIYELGDFNINFCLNNSCIFQKINSLSQSIPSDIKKYYEFCTMSGLT